MGRIDATIVLNRFEVGNQYSRPRIASLGGLPVPDEIYGTPWADGILELENAILLFVTLEKNGESNYLDFFDGNQFIWESQNRHTQSSPIIEKISKGFPTYLFVRIRAKLRGRSNAMPFVHCGRLSIQAMNGQKPVTCLFNSIDYQDNPAPILDEIYQWRPAASNVYIDERINVLKEAHADAPMQTSDEKCLHAANAVQALGRASVQQVDLWLAEHYPKEDRSHLLETLTQLTVNTAARMHHDRLRKNWRSDYGHGRDRLVQIQHSPSIYEHYNPAVHGYFDLRLGEDGEWQAVPMVLSRLGKAEAQGREVGTDEVPELANEHDARVWTLRLVSQRQGQPEFRSSVLDAYEGMCCITGSSTRHVLEAAHILPYKGKHSNTLNNALLLRSDIHTLFDLGLLWIDGNSRVRVSPSLDGSEYSIHNGKAIRLPQRPGDRPGQPHLAHHAALALERMQNELGSDSHGSRGSA